jgi:hypothetical protein
VATSTKTVNPGTQRIDNWRLEPILTVFALGLFILYATYRAFQNGFFEVHGTQYISPFYSPYFPHVFNALGIHLNGIETILPGGGLGWLISPALFILWVPAGFRMTCYFYRRTYYRSFFTAPVACAVDAQPKTPLIKLLGEGRKYMGERLFPMVLMNLHRYFFFIAAAFILIHVYDTFSSFFLPGYSGIRVGMGSLIFVIDLVLLSMYTFGCHSWRHLLGGKIDCFSSCPVNEARHHAWTRQSVLNEHHMFFAWVSMFWVAFADFYIAQLSKGVWTDIVFYSSTWKGLLG